MIDKLDPIHSLSHERFDLDEFFDSSLFPTYAQQTLSFARAMSRHLLTDLACKQYPELVSLGFWLRDANLFHFEKKIKGKYLKPLGSVLHITPNNVDTMFMYSWICSLLMGNRNLVRVSTKESRIKALLLKAIKSQFSKSEFAALSSANQFISYEKASNWTTYLSARVDARVIWGGDETVSEIRAAQTGVRCRDVSFADRQSVAIVNGDMFTNSDTIDGVAERLWRDTHPYEQQACSSPRIIFWLGELRHQRAFFEAVNTLATATSQQIYQRNERLVLLQQLRSSGVVDSVIMDDAITAMCLAQSFPLNKVNHPGYLQYFIVDLTALEALPSYLDEKVQTVTYAGIEVQRLLNVLSCPSIKGVDRVVPTGSALTFSPVWDGYDLFSQLSREIILE
ncbi:hypothetical protein OE749_12180 [Aestuariibacter sp. AA17]|uniref:Long-chain-fatty-acyl-CoA reductase n=1 Tax=Fluctibacter corallii TaxID=2984329 RepID=A0ABT3A9U2_9ALTE|nr:acyl-CoA reductase [Aestuariibacter sp. AA17]MCV2885453.1 hypothetical protein [Aestuariibacter sp. AA17]